MQLDSFHYTSTLQLLLEFLNPEWLPLHQYLDHGNSGIIYVLPENCCSSLFAVCPLTGTSLWVVPGLAHKGLWMETPLLYLLLEIEPQGAVESILVWMWVEELFQSFNMSDLRQKTEKRLTELSKGNIWSKDSALQAVTQLVIFVSLISHSTTSHLEILPFLVFKR